MASIDDKNGGEIGGILDEPGQKPQVPSKLPVLLLRDVVIFPYMIAPLFVGREKSKNAIDMALSTNRMILLLTQKDMEVEAPKREDVYDVGTVALILRMLKLPDGRVRILAQGLVRARLQSFEEEGAHVVADVEVLEEPEKLEKGLETEALIRNVRSGLERAASLGKNLPPEALIFALNTDDPGRLADLTASNLELKVEEAQGILEIADPAQRLRKVFELLTRELELLDVQSKISTEAKGEMDKLQKQYFLRQQMKAIQKELGEGNEIQEEIRIYQDKLRKLRVPDEVKEELEKQISRLSQMHPESAETAVVRSYLDWMFMLPWNKSTTDTLDLVKARKILDEDHYGLDKVKERILEYLAVQALVKKQKGPILCLVGPPGVGKTSLARSIAAATGRNFVRLALGGVRDEAEIRGHRRTYVGALPGKIIQSLKKAGSTNPVFLLDEVDKMSADFRGDPAAALLEVLDPEQNNAFCDHYLDLDYDLSDVMFITTANYMQGIPVPLQDRMEIVHIPGYTEFEKLAIAAQYLVPKQKREHGLAELDIGLPDETLRALIQGYTKEAGVRSLERELASVCRKIAREYLADRNVKSWKVTPKRLVKYLGPARYRVGQQQASDEIGVTNGLAVTSHGGDLLVTEVSIVAGKGKLVLTGQLGDVMQESAQAAISYIRARAPSLGIDRDFYSRADIHVHLPEGAIPKDGPSAGITICTGMVSALLRTKVRRDVAMTGEITLRGRVLPIGGLKEKILAAHRGGISTVIFPKDNAKDLRDIPKRVLRSLHLQPVGHMDDVLRCALALDDPAAFLKEPSVSVDWRIPVDRRSGERRGIEGRIPVASAVPPAPGAQLATASRRWPRG